MPASPETSACGSAAARSAYGSVSISSENSRRSARSARTSCTSSTVSDAALVEATGAPCTAWTPVAKQSTQADTNAVAAVSENRRWPPATLTRRSIASGTPTSTASVARPASTATTRAQPAPIESPSTPTPGPR